MKAYEFREMLDGPIGYIIYISLLSVLLMTSLTTAFVWIIPLIFLLIYIIFYLYDDLEALMMIIFFSIVLYSIGLLFSVLIIHGSELNTKKTITEYQIKHIENGKIVYSDKLTVTDDKTIYWKCKAINCTKVIETIQTREPDFVHNNLLVFTKTELDVK